MFKKFLPGKHNDGSNTKKKTENLFVFIIILIVTFIAINNVWNDDTQEEANTIVENAKLAISEPTTVESSTEFEQRLENILKTIKDVGNVKVLINYSETSEVIAMYNETTNENTTQESDSNGGTRTSTDTQISKEVVMEDAGSGSSPVTQKVKMPKIEGAIITATGAANANVKTNIIIAVEAVTGLASHKIQVFEMKN